MAGIGFVLRKLLDRDNLSGVFQAYLHAILASSGPWLFTVIALGSFFMITGGYVQHNILENFRVIILYNFAFSLVITAPFAIVATRYLADLIYKEDVDDAPGMMLGVFLVLNVISVPVVAFFYFFFTKMSLVVTLLAIVNYTLISGIWLVCIFISALKQYSGVTFSFLFGLILAVLGAVYFSDIKSEAGMLLGFNIGISFIFASIVALIFAEYPKKCTKLFDVFPYITKYWELALGALCFNLAIWIDKWIMWFSPEATTLTNGMIMYPHYDAAMFTAYLTVIPAMAMFLINQETAFFEKYVNFYQDIQAHVNYEQIEENHEAIIKCIGTSAKSLLILQGSIMFMTILSAPKIFDFFGMNYIQLGIFRFGVLGSAFQIMTLFLTVLLSYFDNRRGVLLIQGFFLITNTLFTLITLKFGFPYYGYGYFLSTVMSFIFAAILSERYVRKLPYYTFVVNNSSVA